MASSLEFLKGEATVKGAFLPNDARAAVAALLVEAALLDGVFSPAERACISRKLKDCFNLSSEETHEAFEAAVAANADTNALFGHIGRLILEIKETHKQYLMEVMWEVAITDGVLHAAEKSYVQKIAEFISVSEHECADAFHRVKARLGISVAE